MASQLLRSLALIVRCAGSSIHADTQRVHRMTSPANSYAKSQLMLRGIYAIKEVTGFPSKIDGVFIGPPLDCVSQVSSRLDKCNARTLRTVEVKRHVVVKAFFFRR